MACIHPTQGARFDIKPEEVARDKPLTMGVPSERTIDLPADLGEGEALSPRQTVRLDRNRDHQGGGKAVAHGIEDGHIQLSFVGREVEGVSGDVIGGLEVPGDLDVGIHIGRNGEKAPLDRCGEAETGGTSGDIDDVTVSTSTQDGRPHDSAQVWDQWGEIFSILVCAKAQHPDGLAPLKDRHPQHGRILSLALKALPGQESTPWQGAPDREGRVRGGTGPGPGQGREDPEPIIDEVQSDLADPKRRD